MNLQTNNLISAPKQKLDYILVYNGEVIETLSLDTTDYPRPGQAAKAHWAEEINNGAVVYLKVGGQ